MSAHVNVNCVLDMYELYKDTACIHNAILTLVWLETINRAMKYSDTIVVFYCSGKFWFETNA